MVFKSERDSFFATNMTKVIINMTLMLIFPFIFTEATHNVTFILVWASLYVLCVSSVALMIFNIKYELHEDHLHVKGGPLRSKIPYSKITDVSTTCDIYEGFRVMNAREGLEITYKTHKWKRIKISPEDQHRFIDILKYRCPQADIMV